MKKPWSITTTIRNPERIRDFLLVLKSLEGEKWSLETQQKFQILLIQSRVYGYGNTQFYNGLTSKQVKLVNDIAKPISFSEASAIFNSKKYEDPSMRGRQSINVLKKFGFVIIKDDKIRFTELGNYYLREDSDIGETFFRSFLKWQIPNLDNADYDLGDGYDLKPFIAVLHLINKVNRKCIENKEKPKGISKQEFSLFGPSLVNYKDINKYANEIIALRKKINGKDKKEQKNIFEKTKISFAKKFLGTKNNETINQFLNNLKDYGDNAIRYFRLTRFIYIRGGGFYIDLEPRRNIEINELLKYDNGSSNKFKSKEDYLSFMSDIEQPKLPWETKEKYIEIINALIKDIRAYEIEVNKPIKQFPDYKKLVESKLKIFIGELRTYRRDLQEMENHKNSQGLDEVKMYIEKLENIYSEDNKPVSLEKYISLALHALNDALKIQPNYPVGDDNEPTFTAPAGKPDIECYYEKFNAICEVTMLNGRDQWYNEGQPVMRHFRDFENINGGKDSYCLFVAPALHRDTLNTFWFSIKYEYEGKIQKIIPLTIENFISLLKILVEIKENNKFLPHSELKRLYDEIIKKSEDSKTVIEWFEKIPAIISSWQINLTKIL